MIEIAGKNGKARLLCRNLGSSCINRRVDKSEQIVGTDKSENKKNINSNVNLASRHINSRAYKSE